MTPKLTPSSAQRRLRIAGPVLLCALVGAVIAALAINRSLTAQVSGDRGIAAVVSSTNIDVSGIEVDERGKNAEEARRKGWQTAQRAAWKKLGGPAASDSQIESMVSSIVIEKENIGPRRYIATLGVIFDRSRAGRSLGASGRKARSAPMLVMPVTISGGTSMVYEQRNPWQRAWAGYQAGGSGIDYVRPSGAGADSLLITYGQASRRSRTWWRAILDQFGAADVVIPVARLEHQFPGGPIKGTFTGRYGPDNEYLGSFTLTAANPAALPDMLNKAVGQFDDMFETALSEGKLKPDPSLKLGSAAADPAIARLVALGRAMQAQERAAASGAGTGDGDGAESGTDTPTVTATAAPSAISTFVVQFASPDAGAVDATLAAVRATPGVRGAGTSSIAIGGTSVMSVTYSGDIAALAAALRGRGFAVRQGANALAISR